MTTTTREETILNLERVLEFQWKRYDSARNEYDKKVTEDIIKRLAMDYHHITNGFYRRKI
jgi:hypothetical protein